MEGDGGILPKDLSSAVTGVIKGDNTYSFQQEFIRKRRKDGKGKLEEQGKVGKRTTPGIRTV